MAWGVYDQIEQQTFLGASILNFSANLGINGSPSELSVNLIEDTRNNLLPDTTPRPPAIPPVPPVPPVITQNPRTFDGSAKGEGYHPTEITAANVAPANIINNTYPGKDYNNLDHTKFRDLPAGMGQLPGYDSVGTRGNAVGAVLYKYGDYFCPPPLGTPVWFNFHKYDTHGNQDPLPVRLMSSTKKHTFNGLLTNYSIKQGTGGRTISVSVQDPRMILQGVQIILDGYRDLTPPADWSTDKITKQTPAAKHPANGEPTRKLHHGYNGYYNILNVYGYYENYFQWRLNVDNSDHADYARQTGDINKPLSGDGGTVAYDKAVRANSGFGMADVNEGGMRWHDSTTGRKVAAGAVTGFVGIGAVPQLVDAPGYPSILTALQHMLMGWPKRKIANNKPGVDGVPATASSTFYDDTGNESLGGPIYYVVKERKNFLGGPMPTAVNEITEPTNVYRFKVDLSDMLKLTDPVPAVILGIQQSALPKYYRVKASSMNLLELIEHVCTDANHDFTVELLPDLDSAGNTFETRSLDGIIKIKVIDKRAKPNTKIIAKEIRKAEWSLGLIGAINPATGFAFPLARTHQWYNRITSYDMGKDFATEPAGKMIVGGPETRVVGADIRLGVDRIDFTKCACVKDENVENQVVGTPVTNPLGLGTRAWCEGQGDEYHWRCFRRPTEFDGVQLPGAYRLDNNGTWGLIETSVTDNNNVYSPGDWRVAMDPDKFGGFFNDTNLDYDDADRLHIQNATNLTPIDASVNLLSGAGTGGREVWSVWGKLRHSPLGNSHDGLDGQYVTTDVDDEYDYCNAETGQCRFIRGYSNTMLNGDGEVVTQGGEWQTPEYYAFGAGKLIFNKNFRQDYRIDLFPCWGFMNVYENETVGGSIGKEDVVIADRAVPIKGDFDEMNPYRDFSPSTGIGSNYMYVLNGPLDPSPGAAAGGLGKRSRGGPGGGPGSDQYDSVEWCVEKLILEAGAAGNVVANIAEYTRDYVAPCNPQSGSRIFGYRRSKDLHNKTGDGPRVADESLDELLDGGTISDDDYITIVTLQPIDEDTWSSVTSSYKKHPSAVTVLHKNNNGMYPSPPAATIPIDLREAGIQDLKHGVGGVHLATITELRHALISKLVWEDYLRSFDRQYADDLGVGDTGVGNSSRTHENAPVITEADGTNPTVASLFEGKSSILPNSKNYGALLTSAVNVDENDTDKRRTKVYEITKGIADGYYGKKFLMPLPYDPQRLSEFEKRTYVDDEQKIAAYKITNKWEIAQAGWVDTETNKAQANTAGGENAGALMAEQRFIKYPTDSRFFNSEGMLEPYVVFPHKVWVDVKKTREEWKLALPGAGGAIQKNRVNNKNLRTKTACPPCDGGGWKFKADLTNPDGKNNYQNGGDAEGKPHSKKFPEGPEGEVECRQYYQGAIRAKTDPPMNLGVELDDGIPLEPGCLMGQICNDIDPAVKTTLGDGSDVALGDVDQQTSLCNYGHIRADEGYVELSFEPLDFSEFDRNDYYIENTRDDAPVGAYCTNAKYGDKATCEDTAKDRQTKDGLPLDINPGRWITNNSYLTRVFVKASVDPKTHWLPSDIYNNKGVGEGGSAERNDSRDQLRPYGLISLNGVVRYPKDTIIGSAGANLGGAHFHLHLNTKNAYFGSRKSFSEMAPAAFKPWEAAIPQQSSVNSWGPWSNGEFYGAAQFEEDSSLSPEQYGSLHGMNLAGDARAGLDGIDYQEQESGSVTVTGLPESPLAGRLFAGGPYITNISVDIGTGGITTGYRMETYKRHIGRETMNEVQRANRIRKAQNAREKEARDNRRFRNRPKKD